MRIIHCADIHIGSVMQSLPSDKAKIRKRETLDSFFEMLSLASRQNVNAILIAGDFFDVRKLARSIRKEILDAISAVPQIKVLYLCGNHDSKAVLEDDTLPAPPNLLRFDCPDDWTYFDFGDVCVAGIDALTQQGTGFYDKLRLDKKRFNIAVLHGDLKTLQLDRLRGKGIDYLALGDIHIPDMEAKRLDARGVYGYSGCLEGRGYDETGERGFFVLDIEDGRMTRTFCTVAKRVYHAVFVDISNLDSHFKIDNAIKTATADISKDDIVKVVLCGKRNADTQVERDNLEKKLTERFFHAKVKDESTLNMQSVAFDSEVSLRSEFVRLVAQSNLAPEEKEKIIEYGIKALCGEAVDL